MENRRPSNPQDGPRDGVIGVAECIRTDFLENPAEGKAAFQQREKSDAHISASMEIGIFSIRDMQSGVMLAVSLQDAMEVIVAATNAAKQNSDHSCIGNVNSEWISVKDRLPKEKKSIFAKLKGTDKWSESMFERKSDKVNVMLELEDGSIICDTSYTVDGRWMCEKERILAKVKVIAWKPLPEVSELHKEA